MDSGGQPSEEGISTDAILDVLSHYRRRVLLHDLRRHDGSRAIADLARTLAIQAHGGPLEAVPDADLERIRIRLYHVHVPKLADADAVEVDREQNTVELTERGTRLCTLMDRIDERLADSQCAE